MNDATRLDATRAVTRRVGLYYGWVQVLVAAVAMTATLPGRTHGLGLVTEPLLQDFQFDRVTFANSDGGSWVGFKGWPRYWQHSLQRRGR